MRILSLRRGEQRLPAPPKVPSTNQNTIPSLLGLVAEHEEGAADRLMGDSHWKVCAQRG